MNNVKNNHVRPIWLVLFPLLLLTACSTVTTSEGMRPDSSSLVGLNEHGETLSLLVSGEPRGITVDNFKQALSDGITESRVFSAVNESGDYLLDVRLHNVTQPMFGAGFKIAIDSTWRLFRLANRELIWAEEVNSVYQGGGLEGGFVAMNRIRVATEKAARANIQQGIQKLGQAEID